MKFKVGGIQYSEKNAQHMDQGSAEKLKKYTTTSTFSLSVPICLKSPLPN